MSLNLPTLLDVAIGLVFIFFVFSLFVSGLVELLNTLIERRAVLFRLAIDNLLQGDLATRFFAHKLSSVKDQTLWGFKKPISYLSANSFSTVLIDLIVRKDGKSPPPTSAADTFTALQQALTNGTLGSVTDLLAPMLAKSQQLADFIGALETWYNGYMEQVSGWYKRYALAVVRLVAVLVAVGLNVDTVLLTSRLFHDDGLRERVVAAATRAAQTDAGKLGQHDPTFVTYLKSEPSTLYDTATRAIKKPLTTSDSLKLQAAYVQFAKDQIDELQLPVGWHRPDGRWAMQPGQTCLSALIGWILTAAALSFGAPFWFDLLLKLVNIRNTARRPAGNPEPS